MNICDEGQLLNIKGMIFNDGYSFSDGTYSQNYCDSLDGHPGVALLPTDENDKYIYAIHMTSSSRRANKEEKKYKEIMEQGVVKKQSFINLEKISLVSNSYSNQIQKIKKGKNCNIRLGLEEYSELLQSFYNYHNNPENNINSEDHQRFEEIKKKIEMMMCITDTQAKINKLLGRKIYYPNINAYGLKMLEQMHIENEKYILKTIAIVSNTSKIERDKIMNSDLFEEREKEKIKDIIEHATRIVGMDWSTMQEGIKKIFEVKTDIKTVKNFLESNMIVANALHFDEYVFKRCIKMIEQEADEIGIEKDVSVNIKLTDSSEEVTGSKTCRVVETGIKQRDRDLRKRIENKKNENKKNEKECMPKKDIRDKVKRRRMDNEIKEYSNGFKMDEYYEK